MLEYCLSIKNSYIFLGVICNILTYVSVEILLFIVYVRKLSIVANALIYNSLTLNYFSSLTVSGVGLRFLFYKVQN